MLLFVVFVFDCWFGCVLVSLVILVLLLEVGFEICLWCGLSCLFWVVVWLVGFVGLIS